jgi:hypothetical protein
MKRDHLPPIRDVPEDVETQTMDQTEVKSYAGGSVKSFERKAAWAYGDFGGGQDSTTIIAVTADSQTILLFDK